MVRITLKDYSKAKFNNLGEIVNEVPEKTYVLEWLRQESYEELLKSHLKLKK